MGGSFIQSEESEADAVIEVISETLNWNKAQLESFQLSILGHNVTYVHIYIEKVYNMYLYMQVYL